MYLIEYISDLMSLIKIKKISKLIYQILEPILRSD